MGDGGSVMGSGSFGCGGTSSGGCGITVCMAIPIYLKAERRFSLIRFRRTGRFDRLSNPG
jgi:hypothetical protein